MFSFFWLSDLRVGVDNEAGDRLQAEEVLMDDDVVKSKKPGSVVGENLSELSVSELEERIVEFEAEIERVRAEIAGKQSSKIAADSFFKV